MAKRRKGTSEDTETLPKVGGVDDLASEFLKNVGVAPGEDFDLDGETYFEPDVPILVPHRIAAASTVFPGFGFFLAKMPVMGMVFMPFVLFLGLIYLAYAQVLPVAWKMKSLLPMLTDEISPSMILFLGGVFLFFWVLTILIPTVMASRKFPSRMNVNAIRPYHPLSIFIPSLDDYMQGRWIRGIFRAIIWIGFLISIPACWSLWQAAGELSALEAIRFEEPFLIAFGVFFVFGILFLQGMFRGVMQGFRVLGHLRSISETESKFVILGVLVVLALSAHVFLYSPGEILRGQGGRLATSVEKQGFLSTGRNLRTYLVKWKDAAGNIRQQIDPLR